MNILYIITILALFVLFMLIQKTEKKQNAITWIVITTVITLCYNTLVCVIHSFIDVASTLLNLSITNIIVITIIGVFLLKSKKIQKYYVKIFDIVFLNTYEDEKTIICTEDIANTIKNNEKSKGEVSRSPLIN